MTSLLFYSWRDIQDKSRRGLSAINDLEISPVPTSSFASSVTKVMDSKVAASHIYEHSKLTSRTSIRLLRLLAGAQNDKLRCDIDIADIENDLDYEAVSYVWGTSEPKPSIQISCEYDNSELEIPKSLEGALRRFRHPTSTRTLWTDSICINQSDLQERSQQVRLMGHIYRKASAVLIWLGEDVDGSKTEHACKCMNLLKNARPRLKKLRISEFEGLSENTTKVNSFLGVTRRSPDDVHHDLDIPLLSSPGFEALLDLLKNPWFSRAWTWQESFLAKKRILFRGSWSWSGQLLIEVCLILDELSSVCGYKDSLLNEYFNVLPMIAGLDFWTRREESTKRYLELPALLTLRRGSGCTYPSDLLYSLLGAARESTDIEVDYKQSFEIIFAKSTWRIMIQSGNLSILSKVETDRQPSTLPSWVPDWRVRGETMGVSGDSQQDIRYAATGSSRLVGRLSNDAKVLTISGLKWDQVSEVKNADSAELDDWVNDRFTTIVDGRKFYTPSNESLERALRRVYYLDKTEFTTESEITRWKLNSHEEYETIVQRALSGEQRDRVRYGVLLHSQVKARRSRAIFVTEGGRLGIAPDKVLPGDVITMLLGGQVHVVLRPFGDEDEHYTYIAECYVHGFMDGEGLVEARRSAQPDYDPADVAWLKDLSGGDVPFPVQEFYLH